MGLYHGRCRQLGFQVPSANFNLQIKSLINDNILLYWMSFYCFYLLNHVPLVLLASQMWKWYMIDTNDREESSCFGKAALYTLYIYLQIGILVGQRQNHDLGKARVYTHSCTWIGHCLGLAFFLLNGVLSSFFIFWLVIFILESYQEKKRGNKATEIYGGGTNNYNTIQSIVLNFRANLTLTFLFLNSSAHGLRLIFCANQYTYGRIWKV